MCPTCGVTMQKVNGGTNPKVFWCPRCGTLKMEGGVPDHEAPRILATMMREAVLADRLQHLGINQGK